MESELFTPGYAPEGKNRRFTCIWKAKSSVWA